MASLIPPDPNAYNAYIERMRLTEYPMLTPDSLYLDHAGTTLYSKSLLDRFHSEMLSSLLGNPHSASPASQSCTKLIEDVRLRILAFFNADPESFDVVFTANATAGVKMIVEALRARHGGFWYGYHADCHTSLVGAREEAAQGSRCFETFEKMDAWIIDQSAKEGAGLVAWPAQSNFNGRRLPLDWAPRLRESGVFSLLDAAGLVSTSPLDLGCSAEAPDFTVVSFYKIFGFPDLGALIVRNDCAHVFDQRKYFGGGTVDMVVCMQEQWHAIKSGPLHERLEDGTLPVHSVLALKSAMQTHSDLFGTLARISEHTSRLALGLYRQMKHLRHANGVAVCEIYEQQKSGYDDRTMQGPLVAFNLRESNGDWVSTTEVEKLASIHNISLRTGGMCNPGGIATSLNLSPWAMNENFSAGHRCGGERDIINGKPTGVVRVSLGAMSTESDISRFLGFLKEFFVDSRAADAHVAENFESAAARLHVESLTIYPIKSCAGWTIPWDKPWDVRPEGLAWDREWCLVHQGTGKALSQKQYPRMALIQPTLDIESGVLRVTAAGSQERVEIPLSKDPKLFKDSQGGRCTTIVCGETILTRLYASQELATFFTDVVGVPCTLARFPASTATTPSTRHVKPDLQQDHPSTLGPPLLLSNESPVLTISRSSLNRLNEQIKAKGGKAVHASSFRANIVLSETPLLPPGREQPWAEDHWETIRFGSAGPTLDVLGGCRRCQMVCIDQVNGEKRQEPFVTLAKTRRFQGRVLFGVHTSLRRSQGRQGIVKAGDLVEVTTRGRGRV